LSLVPVYQDSNVHQDLYRQESDLATLQGLVKDCTNSDNDEGAIDFVTAELMKDNAVSISFDVPLFCLATLFDLSRKSEKNKRKITFEGLDVIFEVMFIYRDLSVAIETKACQLLWQLSMDAKDRLHVVQSGGCNAILTVMVANIEDPGLLEMALGALKVLSSSSQSKEKMDWKRSLSVVSDAMQKNADCPIIQSEGCILLGNLSVDDEDDEEVRTVGEKEIKAIIDGILANPEELGVHEAACFTLMRLASSAANVDIIRSNELSQLSLELSFGKNPEKAGNNILILLSRLGFDSSAN